MNTAILTEDTNGVSIFTDIYSKLASERILFLSGELNNDIAVNLSASLALLDAINSDQITLYINSEGGDIRNVLLLYDTIKTLKSPIKTICIGLAADEISIILAAGTPGLRCATKNSYISISQINHNKIYISNVVDAKSILELSKDDNRRSMEILSKCTKKKLSEIMKTFERKKYLNAVQAKKYGFIDTILAERRVK